MNKSFWPGSSGEHLLIEVYLSMVSKEGHLPSPLHLLQPKTGWESFQSVFRSEDCGRGGKKDKKGLLQWYRSPRVALNLGHCLDEGMSTRPLAP